MYKTEDVTCKIIPLYKVTIRYDEKDENYERIVVADTIGGIIEGLIDIEMNHQENLEEDDRHMYFEIQDFLYMPCAGAKRGYHLFDIDDVDCAEWFGSSIDNEVYYYCYFAGDRGVAQVGDLRSHFDDMTFAEPHPVADVQPQPHELVVFDDATWHKKHDEERAVMRAIYRLSKDHPHRVARVQEDTKKDTELDKKAMKNVREWLEKGE